MKIKEVNDDFGPRLIFEDVCKKALYYYDMFDDIYLILHKDSFTEINRKLSSVIIGEMGNIYYKWRAEDFIEDVLSAIGHCAIDNFIPIECDVGNLDIGKVYSLKKAIERTKEQKTYGEL